MGHIEYLRTKYENRKAELQKLESQIPSPMPMEIEVAEWEVKKAFNELKKAGVAGEQLQRAGADLQTDNKRPVR